MEREWYNVKTYKPPKSGMYWVFVIEEIDVAATYYETDAFYDKDNNVWTSAKIKFEGGTITHWTYELDPPDSWET